MLSRRQLRYFFKETIMYISYAKTPILYLALSYNCLFKPVAALQGVELSALGS